MISRLIGGRPRDSRYRVSVQLLDSPVGILLSTEPFYSLPAWHSCARAQSCITLYRPNLESTELEQPLFCSIMREPVRDCFSAVKKSDATSSGMAEQDRASAPYQKKCPVIHVVLDELWPIPLLARYQHPDLLCEVYLTRDEQAGAQAELRELADGDGAGDTLFPRLIPLGVRSSERIRNSDPRSGLRDTRNLSESRALVWQEID